MSSLSIKTTDTLSYKTVNEAQKKQPDSTALLAATLGVLQEQIVQTHGETTDSSASSTSFILQDAETEKAKEKQQEAMDKFKASLAQLEKLLMQPASTGSVSTTEPATTDSTTTDSTTNSASTSSDSPEGFEEATRNMLLALSALQIKIADMGSRKAAMDGQISQDQVTAAQDNLNKVEAEIRKMQKEKAAHSWLGKLTKGLEIAAGALATLGALAVGQPEIAVLILAITISSATGGTEWATKQVAILIQQMDPHMTQATARLIASVIVTVVIIMVTCIAAPAGAAGAAADGAEAAEAGADAGQSIVTRVLAKMDQIINKVNVFAKLSPRVNAMIMMGMQAVNDTHLVNNSIDASNMSAKDKNEWKEDMGYAMMALTLVTSLGAGTGMMSGVGRVAGDAAQVSRLTKNLMTLENGLNGLEGAGKMIEGSIEINLGYFEKSLAALQANGILLKTVMEMSSDQMSTDQKQESAAMSQRTLGQQDVTDLYQGQAAIAQAMVSHSPV